MQSHPPLTSMYEVTRQRSAFTGLMPEPTAETLVVMASPRPPQVGRRYDLPRGDAVLHIGRDPQADVSVQSDAVSRRHCKLTRDALGWTVEDLRSTNGTLVGGHRVMRHVLADGDLVQSGRSILKFLSTTNIEAAWYEEIYRSVIFDGLTQIHNRRYFEEFTERELARARRHKRPLSLLMFDIDHFKHVNDTYGHLAGDAALRGLAERLSGRVRREELFARLAGDEFVVVLPETGPTEALRFAEMLRDRVAEAPFGFNARQLPVTISVGVGTVGAGTETLAALIASADSALYRAKHAGRNTVSG
jgi:two-component system cell cycle response regulator